MKLRHGIVASFVILFCGLVFAAPNKETQEGADHLAASIYTGPAMRTLRELSDGFGGRLTGSPAYNQAAEWAAAKFKSYGIQNVRLEPFAMDSGWTRGTASGQLLAPISRPLHLESLGWSPSTPAGGIKGEVILVDDVSADAVKALAPKVKGKIVIIDVGKIFANGWVKVLEPLEASYKVFKDHGRRRSDLSQPRSQQRAQRERSQLGFVAFADARRTDRHGRFSIDPALSGARAGHDAV